ncbi:bacteriophage abortive infection AbiH family protein [Chryseobacterium sp. LC2016-29]|uniref:AbiH family protein n=1 Tax=Chryseobacterium sp. LC2016-29 TaxID=2897331 RepID=UPI001E5A73EE|nr:AbiH family protein [Chryseobacterium sp. LC2016-29]MCD0479692.1 bacteriophage abortive infection AbiH family protein [Chryseobacterium sp. LC2016-29]
MNRLVIIGNGFDRAHDLPTSYGSFLNYIWEDFHEGENNPLHQGLFNINPGHFSRKQSFTDYADFCSQIKFNYRGGNYSFEPSYHDDLSFRLFYKHPYDYSSKEVVFEFKNKLFELITVRNAEKWVDIEYIYYKALISILKGELTYKYLGDISQLNREFKEIKDLLEHYLTEKIVKKYSFKNSYTDTQSISDLFEYKYRNFSSDVDQNYYLEFPPKFRGVLNEFNREFSPNRILDRSVEYENLFLDFNYTPTVSNYVQVLNNKNHKAYGKSQHLQIHGVLSSIDNPINFGFGDEMDENYKLLETRNDNTYLENIKSFMYLNNSNYRKLLHWIEVDDFQVFIMGHSCGLSDRTLLNTIFEHDNCKSIKLFYHDYGDGTDNFKELSQDISRHFNKKALMRSKVVDKSLSKPLPQNIRFPSI